MKDKITPVSVFNRLEEKYEIADILTALGIGIAAAMLYLKGREKVHTEN
jgi:hypothetical protein